VAKEPLRVKRMIGVLPEDLGVFDALTIEEHLELCGPVYGLSRKETGERAGALLRILGLEKGRYTYLDQCSHGMRKKTALAMALLHNPRVLLLDEPFEGIDPVSSVTIRDLLIAVAGRGIAVFLTSHALAMIPQLATEVMMIRGGASYSMRRRRNWSGRSKSCTSTWSRRRHRRTCRGCAPRNPEWRCGARWGATWRVPSRPTTCCFWGCWAGARRRCLCCWACCCCFHFRPIRWARFPRRGWRCGLFRGGSD
jgi:energy-coupling factor transporter ATP-binding protein EcfA2